MSSSRANIAALASVQQRSEMQSILSGTWPPLKPLPVFRYETAEYRAKIDFDRMRGEWVCRKTSLPSNAVQELRGELRELTLALPHGETETFIEDAEPQEQESEKDANRRLQAIREWRETCPSGARYFELRNYLSENQRREIDDSLRLSLTARQLQFTSKNIAYVFDALSTAGGRFATLIEFAQRNQAKQGTCQEVLAQGPAREVDPLVREQDVSGRCADPDEPPAVSIRDVSREQYQTPSLEQVTHIAVEHFEVQAGESVSGDSAMLYEHPLQEECHAGPFTEIALEIPTGPLSSDHPAGTSRRFPALEISAFQLTAFASIVLFVAIVFAVGLTVGRGPLGSRLRELPKSVLGFAAKSPARPEQANQPAAQIPAPVAPESSTTAGNTELAKPAPSGAPAKENTPDPQLSADTHPAVSNPVATTDAKPSARSPEAPSAVSIVPRSPATTGYVPSQVAPRHYSRASTMFLDVPAYGNQPFRVSFPEQALAATRSLAVSSQLSVVISPGRGPAGLRKPARVEAGELVSFVSPRYPRPADGFARVIKVRATIGTSGQVRDVKVLSGSTSLRSATIRAIRQWRFAPTLLDKQPVQAQQDLTIEFRPSQYPPRKATPHPSQKLVAVN